MKRKDVQHYKMLRRIAEFGAKHVSVFPTTTIAGEILAAIVSAVVTLSEHTKEQVTANAGIRRGSLQRKEAHQALTTVMESMASTARAMNIDDFWMPRKPTEVQLIAAGQHFAEAAGPLKPVFIQLGVPSDFIETLKNAIQNLQAATASRGHSKRLSTRAIDEYEELLGATLNLLGRFDVLVANSLTGNAGIMAEWEAARHVERLASKPRKPKAKPGPEPEPKPEPEPEPEPEKPEGEASSSATV